VKKDKSEDDSYHLPMRLINLLEDPKNWKNRCLVKTAGIYDKGKELYSKVHQNPILYKNMYEYLLFRYASPDRLNRISAQLHGWEMDFHSNNHNEVTKCWRLHLGSSDILKSFLISFKASSSSEDGASTSGSNRVYNQYLRLKNFLRKKKDENKDNKCLQCFSGFYTLYNMFYYALRPFLGASALYFDICKDIVFAILIHESLTALVGNESFSNHPFEAGLFYVLIIAIILVQVLFMVLSAMSTPKVFNLCKHVSEKYPKRRFLVILVSVVFAPLMPAIILANYIFYREQEYSLKRDLQCHGALEYDLGEDTEKEAIEIAKELKRDPENDSEKVSLFRKIQKSRYRAAINRRYYSYYRVIQAAIESFAVLNILILIVVVCGSPGRKINLMRGFQAKLANFLNVNEVTDGAHNKTSIFEQLDLIHDVTFYFAITYSFIMVVTALARYVFHSKNSNMTITGQICFCVYIAAQMVARLTISLAFFSTAELPKEEDSLYPVISLYPASIICIVIFVIHFLVIGCFKYLNVPEFMEGSDYDRFIHVLANTLVVIPYMSWDHKIKSDLPDQKERIKMTEKTRQSSTISLQEPASPTKKSGRCKRP